MTIYVFLWYKYRSVFYRIRIQVTRSGSGSAALLVFTKESAFRRKIMPKKKLNPFEPHDDSGKNQTKDCREKKLLIYSLISHFENLHTVIFVKKVRLYMSYITNNSFSLFEFPDLRFSRSDIFVPLFLWSKDPTFLRAPHWSPQREHSLSIPWILEELTPLGSTTSTALWRKLVLPPTPVSAKSGKMLLITTPGVSWEL